MHIPDNYLSASTCAVLAAAVAPVWIHSVKKVTREFPKERFSALGVAAAFSFLAMMFNVPLPGGTTGHAVGGTVLAVLLGPEAACLALSIALLIQALLFGDGGVLAFGANAFNMAFVLPFAGYYSYLAFRRVTCVLSGKSAEGGSLVPDCVAVALASYVGINLAALAAAVEFGVQPLLFTDGAGQALYCPYPLSVSIPAMTIGHLTLFGAAEVVFSVAVYAFIVKTAPDFAVNRAVFAPMSAEAQPDSETEKKSKFGPVYLLIALLVVCAPLGLLAEGTAWGEWGADEIAETTADGKTLGYTPAGMTDGFAWSALIPDYSTNGLPDWAAYVLSAIAGVALSVICFKLAAAFVKSEPSQQS